MKILHIEDEIWDSGIAHYALTLAVELKARGHQVHFWGAQASYLCGEARRAGLETLEVSNPWLGLARLRAETRRRRIELINVHTGSAHSLAAALAAGSRTPIVRTRGDSRPPTNHALARALSRRTTAYVAANGRIREALQEAYPDARVEVIHQGLADVPAPPLPAEPVVGILGRLDPVKGHENFIVAAKEVLRSVPQARFLIAGQGTPERTARLKEWVARLGLAARLDFLGFVDSIDAFMARCRVGVVASVASEAVSRAALEWLARGRPVVAAKVGCLPDIINDSCGVLVPPDHPGQIALALKQYFKDPALAERKGAGARRRYEEAFTLRRFADDTLRLYEDVLHPVSLGR